MQTLTPRLRDSLSGIRVVKSFANEKVEMKKFRQGNERFVNSKKLSYKYMGTYNSGMGAFTTLITISVLLTGAFYIHKRRNAGRGFGNRAFVYQ